MIKGLWKETKGVKASLRLIAIWVVLFFRKEDLLFSVSISWKCHNFYLPAIDQKSGQPRVLLYGFDKIRRLKSSSTTFAPCFALSVYNLPFVFVSRGRMVCMNIRIVSCWIAVLACSTCCLAQQPSQAQLQKWLKRFPAADANKDGQLTGQEASAYWQRAKGKRKQPKAVAPAPTHENVSYGPYDRNVFDLWIPDSKTPTPLIVFIHGGGFTGGSKDQVRGSNNVQMALGQGIAFASIQYRFRYPDQGDMSDPQRAGINDILRDSARAIQFLRLHAKEYNLDAQQIACYGGSAGAGTSIWLAFHDDLADPDNADPVLRQSTRISAAGMMNGQFTYDLTKWDQEFVDRDGDIVKTHGRNGKIDGHRFYGLSEAEFAGPKGKKAREDVDMRALVSADDPPVYILTSNSDVPVKTRGIYNHHPRHATLIESQCKASGVEVVCHLPKVRKEDAVALRENPNLMMEFFFRHLSSDQ